MKIGILEPVDFSEAAIKELSQYGELEKFDGHNLNQFLKDKEVLFIRLNYDINKAFLNQAPCLKYICSPTTGLNHIDLDYCKQKAVAIISLKGEIDFLETIRATPEHTLGLILALKRNYRSAFLNTNNSIWDRNLYRGFEIYGSHIGIIGLGRVGKILSKYLTCMGAHVAYYDINPNVNDEDIKKYSSIPALISSCDTIVLCSSYLEENGVIINQEEIALLKKKYFINTARAELTNETYLSQMALEGHFKGIAVDVIQGEQSTQENLKKWILAADSFNVIITPHIGGATYTSMNRTEEFIELQLKKLIG